LSISLLVIALGSLLGGLFGPGVPGVAAASGEEEIGKSLKDFSRVYRALEENYADKVQPDKAIYQGAIPGMLRTLDPHSNFYDPRAFALQRETQRGQYFGVGMSVQQRGPLTMVVYAFANSPANRAGLRPGDLIKAVNGKKAEGLTTTEVVDLLKGPRGTEVAITIQREGVESPLTFKVVRDAIERRSVEDAFFHRPGVAYLRITEFNENTSREMEDNFRRLGEDKIEGLILDLQDNGGGLLQEGVAVADHFLQRGQGIVSHKGRAMPERGYSAKRGSQGRSYPVVILVDRDTASAAEIVAGALQDHDRAWILGERTFGKGLVQTVYPLPDNTGLALTTAHYYTPSGRLIQRDYSKSSFFNYYWNRDAAAKKTQPSQGEVAKTDAGRTVYGGNGITPDETYTPEKVGKLGIDLIRAGVIGRPGEASKFVTKYLNTSASYPEKGFRLSDAMIQQVKDFAKAEKVSFTDEEWKAADTWIRARVRSDFHLALYGFEAARMVSSQDDPIMNQAVQALPKAKQLLTDAAKVTAQRGN
jgi:carboxyl-terminal processing protease